MKKIFLIIAALFILVSSCNQESFFNFERPPQTPYNNLNEFERSVIGAYGTAFSGGWGNPWPVLKLFKNTVADDVATQTPNDNNWGWLRDTENQKGDLSWTFPKFYQAISTCNDALDFVNTHNGDPFPGISDDDRKYNLNRIIGELHFIRGYCYYNLATVFGDAFVPGGANDSKQLSLRTTFSTTAEEAIKPKIGTTAEIWNQILADFKTAYDSLPEQYIAGKMYVSYSAGRANKFAAAAMLSRTYFYMGNYIDANTYADYVITQNNGAYDLSEDPIMAYNKSTLAAGKESILWFPFYDKTLNSPPEYAACFSHLFNDDPCSWTMIMMDFTVLKRIGWMSDPKNDTTITNIARRDKRFQQLLYVREPANVPVEQQIPGKYYEKRSNLTFRTVCVNKFFRAPGGLANYPDIRLAEMYLNRCICQFKAGNKSAAANDLNVIRKRAWDANVAGQTYESSDNFVTDSNITEQMINDERLIEMFGEGDRIDYMRGLKENIANGERGPGSVPYTSKGFVWPIPIAESQLNQSY